MVNPNNEPQNLISPNGDYFFHESVSKQFKYFLLLYSVVAFIAIMTSFILIESPQNYKSKIGKFIRYLLGKDSFEFLIDNMVNSISIVNDSLNISNLKEKSIL